MHGENAAVGVRTAVEHLKEPVFAVVDRETIAFANRRFLEITETDRESVVGGDLTPVESIIKDDVTAFHAALEAVDRGRSEEERVELSMCHPESAPVARRLPAEARLTRIVEDGTPRGVLVVLRDVSTRVAQAQAIQRQNERLEEFVSHVSHDLRNPLNVAQGYLELARGDATDAVDEHLVQVEESHDRMDALIEALLELARGSRPVVDPEPVALAAVARDCWAAVATESATLAIDTDAAIRADRAQLQQLLENLFRNAVEHSESAVTVTVGDLEGETDGFSVTDDGPGIPPPDRQRVFESGYTTTDAGTGFGLSIVSRIADVHGWTIDVVDGTDGGTRFEVTGVETV
jgi:PAS domain S-box-containing protein